jgi:hypothetical protein
MSELVIPIKKGPRKVEKLFFNAIVLWNNKAVV